MRNRLMQRCLALIARIRRSQGEGIPPSDRSASRAAKRGPENRRGAALILSLIITVSLAGLVTSAIYLGGNATMLVSSADRERDFKYASEAALAIGKSRLNYDPLVVPDTGYVTLLNDAAIQGADGKPIPGVKVNMYIGPTSSNTGQFGRFVSVVTQAHDARGARFVRRLELAQESFAKFAYWTDKETNNGTVISFAGNDQLWGPVWSNDIIHINSNGGATFHNDVGTAKYIDGVGYGTFHKGYSEYQRPISLPTNANLSNLPGYANSGNMNFTAPNSGSIGETLMRIEFIAIDLDGDGRTTGADEGFFRVYRAASDASWLRGDWGNKDMNCGAFYNIGTGGIPRFVPVREHSKTWFKNELIRIGYTSTQYNKIYRSTLNNDTRANILAQSTARCFLGGDPHLRAVSLSTTEYNAAAGASTSSAIANNLGGTAESFVPTGPQGSWVKWPGPIDPRLSGRADREYLFPLYRGLNAGTKGVIFVNGTVGVSGTIRSRITLYATGNVLVLNDLRYATDPSTGLCSDILGIISANNIMVADNSLQGPQDAGGGYRDYGNSKDVYIHGIMMALNTSFGVERYDQGSMTASKCETRTVGRGCLYLTGGLIQLARGAVGTTSTNSGTGYIKRYSYDRCALYNPPPYFPTTGRYTDNRYYEIDPVQFDVGALFRGLMPGQ